MNLARLPTFIFAVLITWGATARIAEATSHGLPTRNWYSSMTTGVGYSTISGLAVNTRFGAWAVVSPNVHLGGFLGHRFEPTYDGPVKCYDPGTIWEVCDGGSSAIHSVYLGVSGRFGASVAPWTWLGFGLDLGLTAWRHAFTERRDALTVDNLNAYFFPGLVLLWMRPAAPLNLGIEFKVGLEIIGGGRIDKNRGDNVSGTTLPSLGPMLHLGFAFGR
jgi:hypothetical protein